MKPADKQEQWQRVETVQLKVEPYQTLDLLSSEQEAGGYGKSRVTNRQHGIYEV